MSDTYNPDEIVKCKHLNEFARQLRIKLDGQTDPKPVPSVISARVGNVTIQAANFVGNTVNFTVPVSAIGGGNVFSVRLEFASADKLYGLDALAYWEAENTGVCRRQWTILRNGTGQGNAIEFGVYTTLGKVAQSIQGQIHLLESDTYAASDYVLNIEFVEE